MIYSGMNPLQCERHIVVMWENILGDLVRRLMLWYLKVKCHNFCNIVLKGSV